MVFFVVCYWDELKKVLKVRYRKEKSEEMRKTHHLVPSIKIKSYFCVKTFGDRCEDFGIPEESEWAAELIKEGFTLEFMKNAIIRKQIQIRKISTKFSIFYLQFYTLEFIKNAIFRHQFK
jgi:hypothetical protein